MKMAELNAVISKVKLVSERQKKLHHPRKLPRLSPISYDADVEDTTEPTPKAAVQSTPQQVSLRDRRRIRRHRRRESKKQRKLEMLSAIENSRETSKRTLKMKVAPPRPRFPSIQCLRHRNAQDEQDLEKRIQMYRNASLEASASLPFCSRAKNHEGRRRSTFPSPKNGCSPQKHDNFLAWFAPSSPSVVTQQQEKDDGDNVAPIRPSRFTFVDGSRHYKVEKYAPPPRKPPAYPKPKLAAAGLLRLLPSSPADAKKAKP